MDAFTIVCLQVLISLNVFAYVSVSVESQSQNCCAKFDLYWRHFKMSDFVPDISELQKEQIILHLQIGYIY